jgi:hypothetical protein
MEGRWNGGVLRDGRVRPVLATISRPLHYIPLLLTSSVSSRRVAGKLVAVARATCRERGRFSGSSLGLGLQPDPARVGRGGLEYSDLSPLMRIDDGAPCVG